jgi:hypothetical protein
VTDALIGLDQFASDASKVKRQTFQNWVSGAAKPEGGSGSKPRRVDTLGVAANTLQILGDL